MGTTSNSYFKDWYEANKEAIKARRKARYDSDPARREKAISYQREYRSRQSRSTRGEPRARMVAGKLREVVRISGAAQQVGCSLGFIRKYEKEGVIPGPQVDSTHRYYTERQVALIRDFYDVMLQVKFTKNPELKQEALKEQKLIMSTNWNGD